MEKCYTPRTPLVWAHTLQYRRAARICFSRWGIEGFPREKVGLLPAATVLKSPCLLHLSSSPIDIQARRDHASFGQGLQFEHLNFFSSTFQKEIDLISETTFCFERDKKSLQGLPCKKKLEKKMLHFENSPVENFRILLLKVWILLSLID